MTDQSVVEQAEREIATELGLHHCLHADSYLHAATGQKFWPHIGVEGKLWQALVRDRCSLLALRKAAELSADSVHNGLKKCDCGACGRVKFVLQRGALEGER